MEPIEVFRRYELKYILEEQQYRELMNQLNWGAQRYNSNPFGQGYGNRNSSPCGTGNMCCDLWIADSLCECMGGDLCPCI